MKYNVIVFVGSSNNILLIIIKINSENYLHYYWFRFTDLYHCQNLVPQDHILYN